ncbi:hypothetical protein B0H10DRAFT_2426924 [Mycena sp. CBHHK59/15]|nr:hypothetical protein B0H10DRAFT_2426924 [Mycena sp. CBHHK59/15]
MEMPRPGLQTRGRNKNTHPAVNAGVEKKTRRNAAEMQKARTDETLDTCLLNVRSPFTDETTAKAQAKLDQKKAQKCLAVVEDKQQREDIAYAKTANHPPERSPKLTTPSPKALADRPQKSTPAPKTVGDAIVGRDGDDPGSKVAQGTMSGGDGDDPDSGDDSHGYDAASGDESSEESDSESDDSDEDVPSKQKKKKKSGLTRADIVAARNTRDGSGTPSMPAKSPSVPAKRKSSTKEKNTEKRKRKKAKTTAKKSGLQILQSAGPPAPSVDNDSMVALGGPAVDNDMQEHVERPKAGKKKKGLPTAPIIAIQPAAPRAPSRKEQRGGNAKWTLQHLPPGTASEFTDEVVALARELVGTVVPWARLNVPQIQDLVDKVFGSGKFEVTADGPWVRLVGYRLNDWRNGIGAQPHKAMEALIESYQPPDSEEEEDEEEGPEDHIDGDNHYSGTDNQDPPAGGATTAADAAPTAVDAAPTATAPAHIDKAGNFKLNTTEGRAAFVQWALQHHAESGTMAFHWGTWGNGVDKKGFLQSYLILHAFSYHLACLEAIPSGYGQLEADPEAALLMSEQAVQRELGFCRTGEYVNPGGRANAFSEDNWGDTVTVVETNRGKKRKLVRRATRFLSMIKKWDAAHWKEVIEAGNEYMELPSCKRGQSASRSGSEAGDDVMLSDDDVSRVNLFNKFPLFRLIFWTRTCLTNANTIAIAIGMLVSSSSIQNLAYSF